MKAYLLLSASTANTETKSNIGDTKRISKRWISSLVRCEYCARVDHSSLIVYGEHELRRCTYEYHGYFPPMNAIVNEDGELFVSPTGTTCSHFLSRAW